MTDRVLIQCPVCNDHWIREDEDLCCQDCVVSVEIDMTIADLVSAIDRLREFPREELQKRGTLLNQLQYDLHKIIPRHSS